MGRKESKGELVVRFVEYMAARQVERFGEVVAEDYVQHSPMVKQGLEGIVEAGRWFHDVFPDIEVKVMCIVVEEDMVVGHFAWSGTQRAEFMGLPASNNKATWTSMDIWRVENGKLAEHWDVVDWAGLMQQLQPGGPTNTEVVKQFYQHLSNSDRQGAFALLSPEFRLVQAASLPYGGVYIGVEGVVHFFEKFFDFWATFKSRDVSYFEVEDKVFATSTIVGTTKKGKHIEMKMVQVFKVEEGKLTKAEPFYFDTALLSEGG